MVSGLQGDPRYALKENNTQQIQAGGKKISTSLVLSELRAYCCHKSHCWFAVVALSPVLEGQVGWQVSSSSPASSCMWRVVFRGALCLSEADFRS